MSYVNFSNLLEYLILYRFVTVKNINNEFLTVSDDAAKQRAKMWYYSLLEMS